MQPTRNPSGTIWPRLSGLNPNSINGALPSSVPTRSVSFSSSPPSHAFSSVMRDSRFASTFEDDEFEAMSDIQDYDTYDPYIDDPYRRASMSTTRGQTGFPFSPLAPVVLARDDPLWCTERFFRPGRARAGLGGVSLADLARELWGRRGAPNEGMAARCVARDDDVRGVALHALRSADRALDAKKTRWLKRVCRAWTTGPQA
ncbi:hypothetical protein EVJ58_g9328 [Rhodofomes roseus]|uniref:Uncharacterized protein n=1 Tax=Rhodofomes roseus TaxID=34475 RepID=A0A4Y9XW60_9APHY|nr:hypothetical protein EVJ58_g9328 [Rhodofomes roseus]